MSGGVCTAEGGWGRELEQGGKGEGQGKILAEGERPLRKRRGLKPELPGAGVGGEGKSTRRRRSDDPRGSSPAGGRRVEGGREGGPEVGGGGEEGE